MRRYNAENVTTTAIFRSRTEHALSTDDTDEQYSASSEKISTAFQNLQATVADGWTILVAFYCTGKYCSRLLNGKRQNQS